MNNPEKDLIIFGAGAQAAKAIEIAIPRKFKVAGYISTEGKGKVINGFSVLGDLEYYKTNPELRGKYCHIAIGENSVRFKILDSIGAEQDLLTLISDKSLVGGKVIVGKGSFVGAGAIIENNVNIGKCCLIDTGAIVCHDSLIGDFVNIGPRATLCGTARVGKGAVIGAGATLIEKITIGENSLVGAGSVVIKDIEPNVIASR
ncbi:MAG: NeuD/PglB/VioB family sugar acetyltransferase, partial [Candidatus Omnitrophota bacterium]